MPDRRVRTGLLLALAGALGLLAALPAPTVAAPGNDQRIDRVTIADAPPNGGEDCVENPDAFPGTGLRECPKGFDVATLLPFVIGGVGVLLALAIGWFLVMRRRAARPFLPDEAVAAGAAGPGGGSVGGGSGGGGSVGGAASGEWWTCRNCGATNLVGSARCYKCGSWPR